MAPSPSAGLARLYRTVSPRIGNLADLRRRKLTQVELLTDRDASSVSLSLIHLILAGVLAMSYVYVLLPRISSFGYRHWNTSVAAGKMEPRLGGPFAEVSLSYVAVISLAYIGFCFLGISMMAQRTPMRAFIFECITVHNLLQCLLNLYCLVAIIGEGRVRGLRLYGNPLNTSSESYALGRLVWLQYHCRQLQLLDTAFMILRKKFHGISFAHLYLKVLNLWGWYIACRFMCGGEAYFPAIVSSTVQMLVYGLYFSLGLSPLGIGPTAGLRAARIFQLQILQYVVCAIHSIVAAIWGSFPLGLALLHLFAIANGLVLYTDFHSRRPSDKHGEGSDTGDGSMVPSSGAATPPRVTFSFDSCGWLFVYHFGVGVWLSEHLGLEGGDCAPQGVAFSGSSGGSLVACVLGAGVKVRDVFEYILEQYPLCKGSPTQMFPAVERALRKFQYDGAHARLTGHIRVLLTRVAVRPPFVMGEVADVFPDTETAVQLLAASCHVPVVAGMCPRRIGNRYYYDGLVWPSRLLVPWRGAEGDIVVRVSACMAPLSDIALRRVPYWWALMPPPIPVLRGIFWLGYRDTAYWFATEPEALLDLCGQRQRTPSTGVGVTGGGDGGDSSDGDAGHLARWHAARALVKRDSSEHVPKVDPVTGEDVQSLIRVAEAFIDRENRLASRALTILLVAATSMVACMSSSAMQWLFSQTQEAI